jgi:hypothetical protein
MSQIVRTGNRHLVFLVTLKKNATDISEMLQQIYREVTMCIIQASVWVKQFQDRRKDVTDNERNGHLTTSGTDPNVKK